MDYQSFTDHVLMPCAVLSVEKGPDGGWGEIRIVCGNEAYQKAMKGFYPGMLYQDLVPPDRKFEDFCYRAAVLGQRMHAYVEVKAFNSWIDQTLTPLVSDDERLGYCQFVFEMTQNINPERMSQVSVDTAEAVLRACVTLLRSQDFRENVGAVLEDLLEISGAFCCRIVLIDHQHGTVENFCERLRGDPAASGLPASGELPYELVRTWEDVIGLSNAIIVKDEQDMETLARRNPAWAQSLRSYRVERLVLIPLRWNAQVFGYLYITDFDAEKTVALKELVELLSFILGSEISNYRLIDTLDQMSRTDVLTGLNNRNAMIRRMGTLGSSPFGIINLDLNGLKLVNDTEGHDAGDRLLVRAAELLGKIFYHEDVFRTGGDEFIVLAAGISRDSFERKLQRLRQDAAKDGAALFSIGSHWSDGTEDVRDAFRSADRSMYEDKRAFYKEHPAFRRSD